MQVDFNILNQRGTPMFFQDALANRPAAGVPGRLFVQTDSPFGIYRDTGSAWTAVATTTGGGGSQDLNSVMSNGTILLNSYDILPLNFDLRIINGVSDFVNFHSRSDAAGTCFVGSYPNGINSGTYFETAATTLHGRYITSTGAVRTFLDFSRTNANLDLGFTDIASNVFLRFNHTSSNRNAAFYYNNIKQGLEFDFDNITGYIGNLTPANGSACTLEFTFDPDDTTIGHMWTLCNIANPFGFGYSVDGTNNIRKAFLGDFQNNFNGAAIVIDDSIPEVRVVKQFANDSITAQPIFNTPISTDPYTPNGDFWLIEIQGVQYGIELRTYTP